MSQWTLDFVTGGSHELKFAGLRLCATESFGIVLESRVSGASGEAVEHSVLVLTFLGTSERNNAATSKLLCFSFQDCHGDLSLVVARMGDGSTRCVP